MHQNKAATAIGNGYGMDTLQRDLVDRLAEGAVDVVDYVFPNSGRRVMESDTSSRAETCPDALQRDLERNLEDYYQRIHRMVSMLVAGSSLEPEDLTQEIFVKAYSKLHTFRGGSSLYTWLYRIARNTCLDALKKKRFRDRFRFFGESENPESHYNEAAHHSESPENREMIRLLHTAIRRLPEPYRSLIVFKDLEEMEYKDIAQIMDAPVGTLKSQVFHARKKLRQILKQMGVNDNE